MTNTKVRLQLYKKWADEVLRKIVEIRMRVQKKIDDQEYRKKIQQLEKITHEQ